MNNDKIYPSMIIRNQAEAIKLQIKEILDRLDFNEWEVDLYKVPITWTELYDVRDYITNLQKENKRLNNIINELEEYLNQEIIEWQDVSDLWTKAQVQEDRVVLNKLNELKENKK